jgi:hypothetical protein
MTLMINSRTLFELPPVTYFIDFRLFRAISLVLEAFLDDRLVSRPSL